MKPPRKLLTAPDEGVDMVPEPEAFEPFTVTADCGECGKRVPEGECCETCHHGCSMPGNDCPGRE